jgi:hypothetical protein
VKSAIPIAGTAGNGVVTLGWHVRHGIEGLEVSCLEPGVTLNTMAAFDGSCFPLFDIAE